VPITLEKFTGSLVPMPLPKEGKGAQIIFCLLLLYSEPLIRTSTRTPLRQVSRSRCRNRHTRLRLSLQFTPTSPTFVRVNWGGSKSTLGASKITLASVDTCDEEEEKLEEEKRVVERIGSYAVGVRRRVRKHGMITMKRHEGGDFEWVL
jgi:hypothetical protein